ncbi:hypothetical protein RB195_015485 [Necator americanus]|uniref:Uncharacterized protein n=1 Tax=Necator americanus TaxID=51031 RepID=A0ABR1E4U2_NECAM
MRVSPKLFGTNHLFLDTKLWLATTKTGLQPCEGPRSSRQSLIASVAPLVLARSNRSCFRNGKRVDKKPREDKHSSFKTTCPLKSQSQ